MEKHSVIFWRLWDIKIEVLIFNFLIVKIFCEVFRIKYIRKSIMSESWYDKPNREINVNAWKEIE